MGLVAHIGGLLMDLLMLKRKWSRGTYRLRHLATQKVTKPGYFSQHGQDRFVADLLGNLRGGVFIDIGAHDGETYSNTCYFERELGWSGIAIEPMLPVFQKLTAARTCTAINGCVADYDGVASFMQLSGYTEMYSGMVESMSSHQKARIEREQSLHGGTKELIQVPCFTLNTILQEHNIRNIDFLSIDTEGSELSILATLDYKRVPIRVICVENNYGSKSIQNFLTQQGYRLMVIAGADEIYLQ